MYFLKYWCIVDYPTNNFIITKQTAPGNPNSPITILVKIFNPIWNWKLAPIRFIMKIIIPPNIEFNINFSSFFIGIINILPNMKIKHIHAKYVIILLSIAYHSFPFENSKYFSILNFQKFIIYYMSMFYFFRLLLKFYPASSRFLNSKSFIKSTFIPFDFAILIK